MIRAAGRSGSCGTGAVGVEEPRLQSPCVRTRRRLSGEPSMRPSGPKAGVRRPRGWRSLRRESRVERPGRGEPNRRASQADERSGQGSRAQRRESHRSSTRTKASCAISSASWRLPVIRQSAAKSARSAKEEVFEACRDIRHLRSFPRLRRYRVKRNSHRGFNFQWLVPVYSSTEALAKRTHASHLPDRPEEGEVLTSRSLTHLAHDGATHAGQDKPDDNTGSGSLRGASNLRIAARKASEFKSRLSHRT
jgi:hypothetical protein